MLDSDPDNKKITKNTEEYDPVSSSIGEYGRWQLLMTFLLSLFNITCTSHIFITTFSSEERDFWCSAPKHLSSLEPHIWREFSQPKGACSILDLDWSVVTPEQVKNGVAPKVNLTDCTKWTFEGNGSTVISEWQLVCSNAYMTSISEMMFLAGVVIGGFITGIISDKYGRKKTLMTLVIIQTFLSVTISVSPSLVSYSVLRFILGSVCVSIVFCGFVLSMELVDGTWRNITGVCYLFPVSLTYCLEAGLAWLFRDWRQLQLVISLPGFLLLLLWFIIPESPRWLVAMKRKNEALVVVEEAIKFNKKEIPADLDKLLFPSKPNGHPEQKQESGSVLDLVRTSRMRRITSSLFFVWFATYLSYYGLVLNIGNIGGNLYINSVLSGLVEIPALAASICFLMKFGRRWPLCLTQAVGGLFCLLTLCVPTNGDYQWLITTLAMVSRTCVSSANSMITVFTAELYPTVIRNLGVGASNIPAGLALILVPFLWGFSSMSEMVPMAVLGVCSIVGGLVVLRLPETKNKKLAETLEDQENKCTEETNFAKRNGERIYAVQFT